MPRKHAYPCGLRILFFWSAPFLVLWTMITLVPDLSAQEPDISPLATSLSKSISASGRKTAAVIDFTNLQGCVTELGRYLAEDLSVALAGDAKGFEVIDRTNLKVILLEHHLASTGIIDPETARKLGQIAGVDTLVTGTISPLGDVIHVSAKALDTNTAMIVGGVIMDIPRTNAVNDLLSKGVTNCAGSQANAQNTSSAEVSNQPQEPNGSRGIAQVTLGDFLVKIDRCGYYQNQYTISCTGTVTNQSSSPERFSIDYLKTYMVDDLGDQSQYSGTHGVQALIGAGTQLEGDVVWTTLQSSLPISFKLLGLAMRDGAKTVSIVLATGGGSTILRNIAIRGL